MIRFLAGLLLLPTTVLAGELVVEAPMVPLAPPGSMVHAAYFTLTNTGEASRKLIGVTAEGYGMAHFHRSEVKDDVATMSVLDQIEIRSGQSIVFTQGGLHVMLARPDAPLKKGDSVKLTLEFANGALLPVSAVVMSMKDLRTHGS